jgi:hypothetical protein
MSSKDCWRTEFSISLHAPPDELQFCNIFFEEGGGYPSCTRRICDQGVEKLFDFSGVEEKLIPRVVTTSVGAEFEMRAPFLYHKHHIFPLTIGNIINCSVLEQSAPLIIPFLFFLPFFKFCEWL